MNALGNGPAVTGAQRERSKNQQVQRALRKIDSFLGHAFHPSFPYDFYRERIRILL